MSQERLNRGREGEEAAASYLKKQGFSVVERNFRCRIGEIDIIASKGTDLLFVEVKTRSSLDFGSGFDAVLPKKQRKVMRVAEYYLMKNGGPKGTIRFGVVAVTPRKDSFHCELLEWRGY